MGDAPRCLPRACASASFVERLEGRWTKPMSAGNTLPSGLREGFLSGTRNLMVAMVLPRRMVGLEKKAGKGAAVAEPRMWFGRPVGAECFVPGVTRTLVTPPDAPAGGDVGWGFEGEENDVEDEVVTTEVEKGARTTPLTWARPGSVVGAAVPPTTLFGEACPSGGAFPAASKGRGRMGVTV